MKGVRDKQGRASIERYRETGNPLYAWHAILEHLLLDKPLPLVLREYLIRVSKALGNPRKEPVKKPAQEVLRALELDTGGGPSYFTQRKNLQRRNSRVLRAKLLATRYEGEDAAPYPSIEDAMTALGIDPESLKRSRRKRTKLR